MRSLIVALIIAGVGGLAGCSGEKKSTFAGQEQPEHQKEMVGQERIDNLTRMLGRDDPSMVIGACNRLEEAGPEAKSALPSLEKVAEGHPNEDVKQAAAAAVKAIKGGGPPPAADAE